MIKVVNTAEDVCPDCVEQDSSWVHLRMCMTCGYVGCCDSSPNKHARAHFEESHHPIIRSVEPGEEWRWCYIDELYMRP
ncbi:UBP-type zinc finger domain-containing protein [Gracilimonas sp.]|uniref:UBP-type zinc finger domain-containing protein n=1 Tax=Gracilimonas TaxID=649462 RepID=UPI0025BEAAD4|nr:UBP-type zinc finger domain-containing protein [Gracilimonas sp.]